MVTIIMPTYKRNDFLSDKNHPTLNLCKNDLIKNILIVWQNIGEEVPYGVIENIKKLGIENKVTFIYPKKNSLNNRFYPYENTCDCIISVDDDYIFSEKAMIECYKQWVSNKDLMVGIVPRFVNGNVYHGNAANGENKENYNIILTGGAMFHKKFLKYYSEEKDNLKLIDEMFNGEDIMFNYVHNHYNKTEPLYIHDDNVRTWKRIAGNSIADKDGGNHTKKRYIIYKKMKEKYGDILITTNKKIIV